MKINFHWCCYYLKYDNFVKAIDNMHMILVMNFPKDRTDRVARFKDPKGNLYTTKVDSCGNLKY